MEDIEKFLKVDFCSKHNKNRPHFHRETHRRVHVHEARAPSGTIAYTIPIHMEASVGCAQQLTDGVRTSCTEAGSAWLFKTHIWERKMVNHIMGTKDGECHIWERKMVDYIAKCNGYERVKRNAVN